MRARNQRGWVEERGTRLKKWYGHYAVYVRDATGNEQRHHRVVVLGDKAKLRKWEAERKLEEIVLRETGATASRPDDAVSFSWFIEQRFIPMREGRWRRPTAKGIRDDISRYLLPTFADLKLRDIDPFLCQTFLNNLAMKRQLSESVVKRCRVMLKAILELALDLEFIRKNPAKKLLLPECKVTRKPTIAKELLRSLLDAISDPRDHLMMMVGIFCAVRPSELFGLKWSSYQNSELMIQSIAWEGKLYDGKTKTKKARGPVYLPAIIRYELERWRKMCPDDSPDALMFPTANRTPMEARNFLRDCIKPIARQLGIIAPVTFQILRRSSATRNRDHGSMKDVQEHLRHETIMTTADYYMQRVPKSVEEMVEADIQDVLGTREPSIVQ